MSFKLPVMMNFEKIPPRENNSLWVSDLPVFFFSDDSRIGDIR